MQWCSHCLFLRAGTHSWPLCRVTPAIYRQPGQLSSTPFSTGPLPVPCKVFSQLDKEQSKVPQRGTSPSLHVLILSLASQAALLTLPYIRFAHGERELSGTSPADFLWRGPGTKKDYCSHEAEDNRSLHTENSSSDVSSAPAFKESVL